MNILLFVRNGVCMYTHTCTYIHTYTHTVSLMSTLIINNKNFVNSSVLAKSSQSSHQWIFISYSFFCSLLHIEFSQLNKFSAAGRRKNSQAVRNIYAEAGRFFSAS